MKKGLLFATCLLILATVGLMSSAIPTGRWQRTLSPELVEELGHDHCGDSNLVCATWIYDDKSGSMGSCCVPEASVGTSDLTACNDSLRHSH